MNLEPQRTTAIDRTCNLAGVFGVRTAAGRFTAFGLLAYVLAIAAAAFTSFQAVGVVTHFTHVEPAVTALALVCGASALLLGALYHAVPGLVGRNWAHPSFAGLHLVTTVTGGLLLVLTLVAAGCAEGHSLLDPAASFAAIALKARPWLLGATAAQLILLLGQLLLVVNFFETLLCAACASLGLQSPLAGTRTESAAP